MKLSQAFKEFDEIIRNTLFAVFLMFMTSFMKRSPKIFKQKYFFQKAYSFC